MPARIGLGKRVIPGLKRDLAQFRTTQKLTMQVAATRAGVSIPLWFDAERFGLATDATLQKLAAVGVKLAALKQS